MQVVRAGTAGFCMGVGRALRLLDKILEKRGERPETEEEHDVQILTYGPIIHNPQVLAHYASLGVQCTQNLVDIHAGDTVVIRAHGVPRQEEESLRRKGAVIRDATCPKVKQAQLSIAAATRGGNTLLLFGDAEHPEVKGLVSYAGGPVHIFSSLAALQTLSLARGTSCVLAAQTTQDLEEFDRIVAWLKETHPDTPVLHTICNATYQRQLEAMHIADMVECMVVVGGRESGNTRRLAEISRQHGVETWFVETPSELPADRLRLYNRVGLTAGASTPGELIDSTQNFLEHLD